MATAQNCRILVGIRAILAIAFIFNAINAVYYYSLYTIVFGITIIIIALALFMLGVSKKDCLNIVYAATAFAEAVVLVPDLSFQYVKALYISPAYAAIVSIIVIVAPLCTYFFIYSHKMLNGRRAQVRYLVIMSVLLGLLSLYSLSFYSSDVYLNSQAYVGSMLFMSEGILFMLITISVLL